MKNQQLTQLTDLTSIFEFLQTTPNLSTANKLQLLLNLTTELNLHNEQLTTLITDTSEDQPIDITLSYNLNQDSQAYISTILQILLS